METERVDYPMQALPHRGAMGSAPSMQRSLPAVNAINDATDTVSSASQDSVWFSVLEAMRHERPARLLYCLLFKRWLDVLIASLLIVILVPVLLLVSLIIWLDEQGPVIYRQRRIGRYGQPFVMYKFRTMIPDRRRTRQSHRGPERREAHKTASDPRVTRVGKFMRRTSIDELPQLFNVLRGEMSLVGPRPELPEIVSTYKPWQDQRHLVSPGITGWWQTHGRSDQMMHTHTDLDIYYIHHISFTMDVRILLGTLRTLASRTGAF